MALYEPSETKTAFRANREARKSALVSRFARNRLADKAPVMQATVSSRPSEGSTKDARGKKEQNGVKETETLRRLVRNWKKKLKCKKLS